MSALSASVVPAAASASTVAQTVKSWRDHYCGSGFEQILNQTFAPLAGRQRVSAKINGVAVMFEPSWFAQGSVVLVFHRPPCQGLRVAFFDQSTGQFLPAVASLTIGERTKLGSSRRRVREDFLRELIASARTPRVPVGS
jgi:hypothetical protein